MNLSAILLAVALLMWTGVATEETQGGVSDQGRQDGSFSKMSPVRKSVDSSKTQWSLFAYALGKLLGPSSPEESKEYRYQPTPDHPIALS